MSAPVCAETEPANPSIAQTFHVTGQAIMISPLLMAQHVTSANQCSTLKGVEGQTFGGLPISLSFSKTSDAGINQGMDPACTEQVYVGGKPLIDASSDVYSPQDEPYNQNEPPAYKNELGYSFGVYLIGTKPYALVTVVASDSFGADHTSDLQLTLYVVRNEKPVEVLVADSVNDLKVNVTNNRMTLSDVERHHDDDECLSGCMVPETMSFDIDPKAGRVHWHAPTARATESVLYWLKEADPKVQAEQQRAAKAEEERAAQEEAHAATAWYILNRYNNCIEGGTSAIPTSPADLITFDQQSGLHDDVVITQRNANGDPIAVEVGEPSTIGNLESVYDFYRGFSACQAAVAKRQDSLKGLN
ncbi:hypothetical protein [Acidisoma sp. C75]